jgi:hypothetical protein
MLKLQEAATPPRIATRRRRGTDDCAAAGRSRVPSLPAFRYSQSRKRLRCARLLFLEWGRIKLSNKESPIHFPATPKMVNHSAVAMLTASSRS